MRSCVLAVLGLTGLRLSVLACDMGSWGHCDHQQWSRGSSSASGTQSVLTCCKPLLVDAVPHEQTHSSLEQIQQQLTQINASLGEAPGSELGGS